MSLHFFFALNITLDHQMKALMNEKCHHWDLKVRKDGFKKVMEFFFFAKCRKKHSEGHLHSPREEKNTTEKKKRACKLNTSCVFFFVTYIYKISETIYRSKK